MTEPDIELSIDEIVVHGGQPLDAGAFEEALRAHLRRRLAADGLPPPLAGTRGWTRLEGLSLQVPHGLAPDALAAHVAEQLHARLSGRAS